MDADTPANDQLVYFNYDVSQRERDFVGYMVSGVVIISIGGALLAVMVLFLLVKH